VFLGTQTVSPQLSGAATLLRQLSGPLTPSHLPASQQSLPVQFPEPPTVAQPADIQDEPLLSDDFGDERNPALLGSCRTPASMCYFSTEQKIHTGGRCFCNTPGGRVAGTIE
jgi:hypothetical protein